MKRFHAIFSISLSFGLLSAQTADRISGDERLGEASDHANAEDTGKPPLSHFSELDGTLSKEAIFRQITSWKFNEDVVVQRELLKVFQERHPELLADALRSSGNMHNPKVHPLGSKFSECLLMTPTLSAINRMLLAKGYSASVANLEKFEIRKDHVDLPFHAIVWLQTQPLADAGSEEADPDHPATPPKAENSQKP